MTTIIKSNVTSTGAGVYPAGMAAYFARVVADGGKIIDPALTYAVFKALEDEGLSSSKAVAAAGGAFGVKVVNGYVTKLYDLWSAGLDLLPSTNAATTVLSGNAIDMPLGLGTGVSKPHFLSSGTWVGTAGGVGFVSCFELDNPLEIVTTTLASFMQAGVSRASLSSAPVDSYNQLVFSSYEPSLANPGYMGRKGSYVNNMVVGAIHDTAQNALYYDGNCERAGDTTDAGYYAGKSWNSQIGSPGSEPKFKMKFCIWLMGAVTHGQVGRIAKALKAAQT
jgi:hypothetical protein